MSARKHGNLNFMKTTLEIPDPVFRRAKATAAKRGVPLRQFITEAVEDKLKAGATAGVKPWMRIAGKLRHLHKETARINKLVEEEFETIEPEDWRRSWIPMRYPPSRTASRVHWKNSQKRGRLPYR